MYMAKDTFDFMCACVQMRVCAVCVKMSLSVGQMCVSVYLSVTSSENCLRNVCVRETNIERDSARLCVHVCGRLCGNIFILCV